MRLDTAPTVGIARVRISPHARLRALAHDLLVEVAADEDEHLGGGSISASAYETAWVALVRHPEDSDRLAFPATLDWLVRHQRTDGGWGPAFPHSLIPTMAALVALRRAPEQGTPIQEASARAHAYLRRVLRQWRAELIDTPFFEFLIPALATELDCLGVHLSFPDRELMSARREAKLARLPLDSLYAGSSSLVHALEVFAPTLDFRRLRALRASNGGYGHSPSATAAVLVHGPAWDAPAARWLLQLEARAERDGDPGAMPASHPADTFEAAWVLHLLWGSGLAVDPVASAAARQILHWLSRCLTRRGATYSRIRGMPADADDTSLVLAVLNEHGVRTGLSALRPFEREAHFISYDGERTASTSTNAHVLDALLSVDPIGLSALGALRRKVVRYLLDEQSPEGYWTDKWHLSPYYATCCSTLALLRVPDPTLRPALGETMAWLRRTQRAGGGWGASGSTLEETAYGALTAAGIMRLRPRARTDEHLRLLRRAQGYLRRHIGKLDLAGDLPAMWVDKTLYVPPRVLRGAVLAALSCDAGDDTHVVSYESLSCPYE